MSGGFFVLLIAVCVPLTVVEVKSQKSGECPPYPNVNICRSVCYDDNQCRGLKKCCETACGGTICIKPVSERIVAPQQKPGYCPGKPTGPWVCTSRCSIDSDCRGNKKCCKNRCGALACVKPEEEVTNEVFDRFNSEYEFED